MSIGDNERRDAARDWLPGAEYALLTADPSARAGYEARAALTPEHAGA